MDIAEHIEAALEETGRILERWNEVPRKKFEKNEVSIGMVFGNYLTSPKGSHHLGEAAKLLLKKERLDNKISYETAWRALNESGKEEIEKLKSGGDLNINSIIVRATNILKNANTFSGTYVYPAIISGKMVPVDWVFGAVRLVSRDIFDEEYGHLFNEVPKIEKKRNFFEVLTRDWLRYSGDYPYILLVKIENIEQAIASSAGREVAEWILNLIRFRTGWGKGAKIRLAGDYRIERQKASLIISEDKKLTGVTETRWDGASLPESWPQDLADEYEPLREMIASISNRFIKGTASGEPVFERLQYGNHLLTESYLEASPRLALVKAVAALETLAVLPREAKSNTLAKRCGLSLFPTAPEYKEEVEKIIQRAYNVRNAVVHGDAPPLEDANNSLCELGPWMQALVIHLMRVLIVVRNENQPQSIRPLRRRVTGFYNELEKAYMDWLEPTR